MTQQSKELYRQFLRKQFIPEQEKTSEDFAKFLREEYLPSLKEKPLKTEKAPPEIQGRMQAVQDIASEDRGLEKFMPGVRSVASGAYRGLGFLTGLADKATRMITKPLKKEEWRGGLFEDVSDWARFQAEYQHLRGMKGIPGEVLEGVGQAAVDIPQYVALGAWGLPIHGALTGFVEEESIEGAAKGALQGALIHGSLKAIGQLPKNMQLPTFFGFGAVTTPGGVKDRTVGALTWTALGLTGKRRGKTPQELYSNFLETYPFIKDKIYEKNLARQLENDLGISQKLLKKSGGAKKFVEKQEEILKRVGQITADGENHLILQKVRENAWGELRVETSKPLKPRDYLKDIKYQEIEQKIRSEGSASLTTEEINYLKDKGVYKFSEYDKNREPIRVDIWDTSIKREKPTDKELREIQEYIDTELSEENIRNLHSGLPVTLTKGEVSTLKKTAEKIVYPLFVDPFYVTPQFSRIGAKETGLALKTLPSRQNVDMQEYVAFVKDINKAGTKRGFSLDDWVKITRLASRTAEMEKLPPAERKKYVDIVQKVRGRLDDWKAKELKAGVFEKGFIEGKKEELRRERTHLNEAKKKGMRPQERGKIQKKINEINDTLKFIEFNKLEYVPIPKTWLEVFFNKLPDKALNIITEQFRERKTINMEQFGRFLLDKGFIQKEDMDIRRILGQYTHQASRKVHLAEAFQQARNEGILVNQAKAKGGFVSLRSGQFPTFKGEVAHPILERYLDINFGHRKHRLPESLRNAARNLMGTTKMLQFYNPLFLPMYDMYQAIWGGALRVKAPKFIHQAWRSMRDKDQSWHDASYWGAFSTPFTPPFAEFMKTIDRHTKSNTFWQKMGRYGNMYRLNWEAAWWGDNLIRMITYHNYISKGLTSKDAAQMTAKLHGDYANVPPQTRRVLNKIFFTPTFKLVMAEAHADMMKNLFKAVNPKRFLDPEADKMAAVQKEKAKAFVRLAGFMAARHWFMHAMGFKTDKFGVKYYKLIDSDEGIKELVVNVPTPDNVALRLLYRYWPNQQLMLDENKIGTFLDKAKWDLHPMYQWAHEMISNRGMDFSPIFNPYDDSPAKIWFDRARYTVKRFLPMLKYIPVKKKEQQLKAYQALRKDFGLLSPLIEGFTTPYIRGTKDKRLQYLHRDMRARFNKFLREDPPKTQEELQARIQKHLAELRGLQEQLDKYYKEWGIGQK